MEEGAVRIPGNVTTRIAKCRRWTRALCGIGFVLAVYALHVETTKARDPSYRAMCDIASRVSCSLVFTSEYGTGFGIIGKVLGTDSLFNLPNGFYGLLCYPLFLATSLTKDKRVALIQLLFGVAGVLLSVYLAFAMVYFLGDACVVCIATYLVNFLLCGVAWKNYVLVRSLPSTSKKEPNAQSSNGQDKKKSQ